MLAITAKQSESLLPALPACWTMQPITTPCFNGGILHFHGVFFSPFLRQSQPHVTGSSRHVTLAISPAGMLNDATNHHPMFQRWHSPLPRCISFAVSSPVPTSCDRVMPSRSFGFLPRGYCFFSPSHFNLFSQHLGGQPSVRTKVCFQSPIVSCFVSRKTRSLKGGVFQKVFDQPTIHFSIKYVKMCPSLMQHVIWTHFPESASFLIRWIFVVPASVFPLTRWFFAVLLPVCFR
jgi:hypothetical protein